MKYKFMIITLLLITCFSCVFASENLNIYSKTAVVIDADSSIVLYGKDMNEKIYPASTTKILTAIIAIENLDLNSTVVVSKTAIAIPWDSSSVYLKEGELVTVKDLLYCLLLNSGNDAANVLAEAVSGDISKFVQLMNLKAKELGCTNTHFNNAHGYSDNNHYTTALDMAKIFKYCIQNETFSEIISTKSYIVEATNKTENKRYLKNTNRLILQKEDSIYARYYKYCKGGKTGYTDEAGRTLVTFAKKDNKTVIVALFGASSSGKEDVRYTDAINLFEYSFNNFSSKTVALADNYNFNYININNGLNYSIGIRQDIAALLKNTVKPYISYILNVDDINLKNFDQENFNQVPVGTITFNIASNDGNNCEIVETLYLKDIQKYKPFSHFNFTIILIIFIISTILLILILILKYSTHGKKKNTRFKNRHTRNRT